MALTVVRVGRTISRLRYEGTTAGGAGVADVTQATLVADTVAGPLRELLNNITSDAVWQALQNDMQLVIRSYSRTAGVLAAGLASVFFTISGAGNRRIRFANGVDDTQIIYDIEHVHSMII